MMRETTAFMDKITTSLARNYNQFPLDMESQRPKNSLKEAFIRCYNKNQDWNASQENLHQFIVDGVTKLDCFTYRAVNQVNGEPVYWNALQQPFDEFKTTDTVIYQADAPYPTADMITAWCNRQRA